MSKAFSYQDLRGGSESGRYVPLEGMIRQKYTGADSVRKMLWAILTVKILFN